MKSISSSIAFFVLLVGCSDGGASRAQATDNDPSATSAPVVANAPVAAASPTVALGLTADQLGDADILDSTGGEIAEVERVNRDASGTVTGLFVEIEDTDPDRCVTIPMTGLVVAQDGDDQNLRSTLTRRQLLAMPSVRC